MLELVAAITIAQTESPKFAMRRDGDLMMDGLGEDRLSSMRGWTLTLGVSARTTSFGRCNLDVNLNEGKGRLNPSPRDGVHV